MSTVLGGAIWILTGVDKLAWVWPAVEAAPLEGTDFRETAADTAAPLETGDTLTLMADLLKTKRRKFAKTVCELSLVSGIDSNQENFN
jgi:hypothetical protein